MAVLGLGYSWAHLTILARLLCPPTYCNLLPVVDGLGCTQSIPYDMSTILIPFHHTSLHCSII
ncbi:predicted protein [Plenodomus lingam JN3]|uniref:Predicted protein n=1 Tax=Leptosphaeria maculans (strain JN3 / isolate v23.1.3 / race Av1-4-5-6-7-8) TaxID=985895 RepID=E5A5K1_LEPMJ|nr:predicted protein [Plenodomus lingam JN3]CBX98899.1 predicted protein [Plenodomus lingam JN3]